LAGIDQATGKRITEKQLLIDGQFLGAKLRPNACVAGEGAKELEQLERGTKIPLHTNETLNNGCSSATGTYWIRFFAQLAAA